jgi:hypothetical protein
VTRLVLGLALGFGFVAACTFAGDDGAPAFLSPAPAAPGAPPIAPPRAQTKRLRLVAPPFDVASTAAALDAWPFIVPGMSAHAVTSFDRSGGNEDGFGGTYATAYVDAHGEHVIFDERGPGVVRTLWMTSRLDGDSALALGRLRFYFDEDVAPRIDADADALFHGTAGPPFVRGLVFDNKTSSGGYVSWAPLPFRRRLRITTEREPGFLQVHFDRLPADWDVESVGPHTTSSDERLVERFARGRSTAALEEIALDGTKTGAGTIDVLRFEPTTPLDETALRAARIRIWFDGAATPHVDAPLGAFFGSGLGVAPAIAKRTLSK